MVVLITGCRSGIGLESAVLAARAGHTVYAGLRDINTRERLDTATRGLAVHPVQLDVTSEAQRAQVVSQIISSHGRIDALINNAGVALGGFLEDLDDDELHHVFAVNVFGVHAMTRAVLPTMRTQGTGTIVMVSSRSGRMAFPGLGAYCASKYALEGMSEAWRHELRPMGIQVYALQPGPFKTDIWDRNRTIGRRAQSPDSPYAPYAERIDRAVRKSSDGAQDPAIVAQRIVSLLGETKAPLRHPLGGTIQEVLRLLPMGLRERIIARVMG